MLFYPYLSTSFSISRIQWLALLPFKETVAGSNPAGGTRIRIFSRFGALRGLPLGRRWSSDGQNCMLLREVWSINPMNIQDAAQQFYDYSLAIKGYSKATIRRYQYAINLYCKLANVREMEQVSKDNVRSLFFHGRIERKWSVNTFYIIHKSLLVFFRWCVSRGYIGTNAVEDIEKPVKEQKLPAKLNRQDAAHLLEVVYNYPYNNVFLRCRNHALFATIIYAGLRKSELLQLKFTDVDMDNRTILIRHGKGNKDRIIPISLALFESLKRYITERKKKDKTCPEFFASCIRSHVFTSDGLRHLLKKIRKASSLQFSIHHLRHTFATLMLEGGCDIYSLSKMMGHSDIKTTTIYLSASVDHLRSQISKHILN